MRKSRFLKAPLGTKSKGVFSVYSDNPYNRLLYGPAYGGTATDSLAPVLYPSDELLLEKGGASALNIYYRLVHDAVVQASLARVMQELISRPIIVKPFSEREGDKVIAEYVENQLKDLDMDQIYEGLASMALITGCSYGEIIWARTKRGIVAEDIRLRDPRIFRWTEDESKQGGFGLNVLSREDRLFGSEVPRRKMIAHRHYISNMGDPYGSGLGRILYPLVKFRRRAMESEILFSDRFANPTAIVTAPLTALKEEIDSLYDIISNLSQETALILPEGYNFDYIGAQNSGSFPAIREAIDKEINILITGEAESGNPEAGSRASSEVAASLRVIRASEISQSVSKTLRKTLIRWIVDLNFGVNIPAPYLDRDFRLEKESTLTINDIAVMKEKLKMMPTREWIESTFKVDLIPEEEMEDEGEEEGQEPEIEKFKSDPEEDIFKSVFGDGVPELRSGENEEEETDT